MLTTTHREPTSAPIPRAPSSHRPQRPRSERRPTTWTECSHTLSGLPCMNHQPHAGEGRGCVHYSTSGVPDRHDYGDDE